ncbi:MAG TPA: hypothetical protein VHI52_16695, partial [Verrucomicrobiae bacterium]|nr:hypothetical protein [Verrucomicrobiae bacterium]
MSTTRTGSTRSEAAKPEARDSVTGAETPESAVQTVREEPAILSPAPELLKVAEAARDGERSEENPGAGAERSEPDAGSNFRLMKMLVGGVILAVVGAGLYWWWSVARCWVETDNAYLASHIHAISARVPGTVKEV